MIWLAKFDAKRVIELLPRSTMMMGVPTHYARLLTETGLNRDSCGSIRVFIAGSAPLSAAAFRAFQERTGHAIVERYGLTETLILVSTPYDTTHNPRLPGAVGMPLPGVRLRIVDDTGQSCPPGGVGHIQVQAPGVFKGYWRLPERARDDFTPDGWFRTGDLGRWGNPPGESGIPDHYLSIVGRDKDLIISGGFNVYAKEIEDVIDGVPGVAETAVIGAAHPDFGEAVVAVVVPRASAALKPAQLIAELKTRMANFKVPKRIHFVPELPRNAMGKVRKNVLRQSFGFPVEVEPRAAEPARVSGQL
jgi:malonyl-CoA/methylmalonyl-CoA synthetase